MPAGWAIAGAALIGGAASYMGAQKQASAAKDAAKLAAGQAATNQAVQQPYVSSGYGALGKLNTLMGINPSPQSMSQIQQQPVTSGIGNPYTQPQIQAPDNSQYKDLSMRPLGSNQNPQLRQLLQIRAENGDAQASQMLGMIK